MSPRIERLQVASGYDLDEKEMHARDTRPGERLNLFDWRSRFSASLHVYIMLAYALLVPGLKQSLQALGRQKEYQARDDDRSFHATLLVIALSGFLWTAMTGLLGLRRIDNEEWSTVTACVLRHVCVIFFHLWSSNVFGDLVPSLFRLTVFWVVLGHILLEVGSVWIAARRAKQQPLSWLLSKSYLRFLMTIAFILPLLTLSMVGSMLMCWGFLDASFDDSPARDTGVGARAACSPSFYYVNSIHPWTTLCARCLALFSLLDFKF
jgi:Ca2+/H+ antiporter